MKQIKALVETLNKKKFEDKYPQYDPDDDKVHLLYVSPQLTSTGYYRAIAPALELNLTDTHAAIVSDIRMCDFNKRFVYEPSPQDERLILWAHYIVLPAMFSTVEYIMQVLKSVNDEVQFVMDLDKNYHQMPGTHPVHTKLSKTMRHQLLENLSKMDIVTGVSEGLLAYYECLLTKYCSEAIVFLDCVPSMVSDFGYDQVKPVHKAGDKPIKIGLVGNSSAAQDILSILDTLIHTKEKYGAEVEIILFGWDGKLDGEDQLEGLEFTTIKSVGFLNYFDRLNGLALDFALLPLTDIPYNTQGGSPVNYLEMVVAGIPVVASGLEPYRSIIKHGETGLLAHNHDTWLSAIDTLVSDEAYRSRLAQSARKAVWRKHGYTTAAIQHYQQLFI